MGQKRIPGGHAENGLVLKGKVSVFNGRPTWTCTFKLTPACLALRVCKMEGGKRSVTYLDAKEFNWPKDVSGGPHIINLAGGLAQALPVVKVSPLKGILVKPVGLKDPFKGQASWAIRESSKGSLRKLIGSSVLAAVPVSMMEVFESLLTAALPASASMGSSLGFSGAVVIDPRKFTRLLVTAAVLASTREVSRSLASVSVGSFLGFSGVVVIDRRMGDIT